MSKANSSTHNQKSKIIEAKPQSTKQKQFFNPQLATRNMSAANSSTRNTQHERSEFFNSSNQHLEKRSSTCSHRTIRDEALKQKK